MEYRKFEYVENPYPYTYAADSRIYANQYNLWDSSHYNVINKVISRHSYTTSSTNHNESQSVCAPEVKPKREIQRDIFNRRIITKESLYKEPEFFYEPENEPESPIYGPVKTETTPQGQTSTARDEWTDLYWRRAGVSTSQEHKAIGNGRRSGKNKDARFKKKLLDSLAQPLKSSKAESMMQKMGWDGGALGKGGSGIVEPIAPNVDYAQTTIGFGHSSEVQTPMKKAKKCSCKKSQKSKEQRVEDFVTNALLYILEFVRNDWEIEVSFDVKCTSKERRILHQCVNEIINECDDELYAFDSSVVKVTNELQERVLSDIRQYNTYVLYTESHGVMPLRQLCLYKDAPEHVYLVTPDDFKDEPDCEQEEEDNPFLKSIKRSLDPDDEIDEPGDLGKLIKFFKEFMREDPYTEFRFLGPFSAELSDCLSLFLSEVIAAVGAERSGKLARLFRDESLSFEVVENCNGTMVIHKHKRDADT